MRFHRAILFLLFSCGSLSLSMADVSISSIYYSPYNTIADDVYLDNTDYSNTIDVSSAGVSGSGSASKSGLISENGTYIDIINSPYNNIGSSIKAISKEFDIDKKISSPCLGAQSIGFDYYINEGDFESGIWNPFSSVQLDLEMKGCEYFGSQRVSANSIALNGNGSVTDSPEKATHMIQDLSLSHVGDSSEIFLSFVETSDLGSQNKFDWKNNVLAYGSNGAKSGVEFEVIRGQRSADLEMKGYSTIEPSYTKGFSEIENIDGKYIWEKWWINYVLIPE